MRLGVTPIRLIDQTRTQQIYQEKLIYERHRHRYALHGRLRKQLEDHGLCVSATSPDDQLVEVIELPDHPFFVASQYHAEFKSRPQRPAPLFRAFIGAALKRSQALGSNSSISAARTSDVTANYNYLD